MKLLIAALALLSFVATSTLPETVVAQAAAGQTQAAPDQTNTGAPKATKKTTHRKHVASKKKSRTKKHATTKKKSAKKRTASKKKSSKKRTTSRKPTTKAKPATSTNPS